MTLPADTSLQSIIDTADRVHAVTNGHNHVINRVNQYSPSRNLQPIEFKSQKVVPLSTRIERSRSPEESTSRMRTTQSDSICYYHRVYGDRAIKCQHPCLWKRPGQTQDKKVSLIDDHRLHIQDQITGKTFLVNTGAECSILSDMDCFKFSSARSENLRAANGSIITTYGQSTLTTVYFGLKRPLKWNFQVAHLPYNLIGALLPDLSNKRLLDRHPSGNTSTTSTLVEEKVIANITCEHAI